MSELRGSPKRSNWLQWVDLRGKGLGGYGFLINRAAGLGLTFYLFLHLIVLGKLAKGPAEFDGFVSLAHSPLVIFGEFIVILAVLLHGINGLRIAITSIGIGAGRQKMILIGILVLAILASTVFALRMFGG